MSFNDPCADVRDYEEHPLGTISAVVLNMSDLVHNPGHSSKATLFSVAELLNIH